MKDAQVRARRLAAHNRMRQQNRRAAMLQRSVQEVNPSGGEATNLH